MLSLLHHAASIYHSISHIRHTYGEAHDEMTASVFALATETVEHLRLKLPEHLSKPRVGIVCGSGLGGLAETVNKDEETISWEYKDVPNFPLSTVPGHEGKLIFSTMGSNRVPVVLLVGRAHFYEGHPMTTVTFATRVCRLRKSLRKHSHPLNHPHPHPVSLSILDCHFFPNGQQCKIAAIPAFDGLRDKLTIGCQIEVGVETMILTNAAGGLNQEYKVGDIVCLNDHLNLAGLVGFHPLRGPNAEDFGTRFPPLSDAYDIQLRQLAHRSWRDIRSQDPSERKMHEGIYAFVAGPTYETRAECRMLRSLGADVVGMSTVPEIIVARHSGMRVLAFSLVTNVTVLEPTVRADDPELEGLNREELNAVSEKGKANHEEVLREGQLAARDMQELVLRVVSEL